jgi:[histone H3]-lysine79 N-trimethyltransferase
MLGVVFKNLEDVDDRSWDPHPTNYPAVELEYPNTGASERCVFL